MLKLLIAEGSEEYRMALAERLSGTYTVRTCREGKEALELVRSFRPDMAVLDMMLPGLDGVSLLQRAAAEGLYPTVLATSRFFNDYVMEVLTRLGVGYVLRKPYDIDAAVERLADLTDHVNRRIFTQPDPATVISNVLLVLGISTKLHGYAYLRDAILEQMRHPGCMVTKELYPAVGKRFHASSAQVERSIRSAIEKAWLRRDEALWQKYFPQESGACLRKPTNAVFITTLATRIQLGVEPGNLQRGVSELETDGNSMELMYKIT